MPPAHLYTAVSETTKTGLGALPLVVIQGWASIFASPQWDANHQELLGLSTNSRLVVVDSAGHGVPSQAPESVVEGINWVLGTLEERGTLSN